MAATTTGESRSLVPLMRAPDHPPYAEMISDAIISLNEEGGSTEASISKHIESTHLDLPPAHAPLLTYHLAKLTRLGEFVQPKPGHYSLPSAHILQNPNTTSTVPGHASPIPIPSPSPFPNPNPNPSPSPSPSPVPNPSPILSLSLSPSPSPNPSQRRKLGRPPKSASLLRGPPRRSPRQHLPNPDPDPDPVSHESSNEPPRRGRGRGRGRPPKPKPEEHENGGTAPFRRRERPPKRVVSDGVLPRRRGRPPKDKRKKAKAVQMETEEPLEVEKCAEVSPTVVKKSKPRKEREEVGPV